MPQELLEFYRKAQEYVRVFDAFVQKHSLIGRASADHICYKCGTTESFESLRAQFEGESRFMYQSIISNRRIAYIGFKQGIDTVLGTIQYLELSDQKQDGSQKEGFDHIEVFPTAFSYEVMVEELKATEKVIHVKRPHHTTDDIDIKEGFLFRATQGPLIEKIKAQEFV